jgi:hypothetical protein
MHFLDSQHGRQHNGQQRQQISQQFAGALAMLAARVNLLAIVGYA